MSIYDVIIVGAGPAGSSLAYRLAREGLDVLLLEQAKMPRVKPCGGGIDGLFTRNLPAGMEVESVIEATATETEVRFQGETQGVYPLPEPIHMTQRKYLDQWLMLQAREAGVNLLEGFKVTRASHSDEDGLCRVWGTGAAFASRVLVGVDGAYSTVARQVGLPTARDPRWRHTFVASEWDVEVTPGQQKEHSNKAIIDCSVSPLGYGWVFPKSDHLNVGFGVPYKKAGSLKAVTRSFLNERSRLVSWPQRNYSHWIPFTRVGAPVLKGNVLLVGDAAGMADPATGAGISWGVRSSALAAAAISQAVKSCNWEALQDYQRGIYGLQRELEAGMALRNLLVLGFALRRRLWEEPFLRVLEVLSGRGNYLDWAREHPWQFRLGLGVQKLLVQRLI
jgi:geranylgeranyl reductase family protein